MAKPANVQSVGCDQGIMLIIHAGAGKPDPISEPDVNDRDQRSHAALRQALDAGYSVLEAGGTSEDAVIAAIHVMEDAPEFNAGRGSCLTHDGTVEMDACLMQGDGTVGAVCGVQEARHPIDAARAVIEYTSHVLVSHPAPELLDSWGVERKPLEWFVVDRRRRLLERFLEREASGKANPAGHGTIGAVARDANGTLCAGTSTGGVTGKLPGRVGDSPIPGSGTYANGSSVAVSCTGQGEMFVQESAGYQLHARMVYLGQSLADASAAVLEAVEDRAGDGGLIALPAQGQGVIAMNADDEMNYGWACGTERHTVTAMKKQ